MLISADSSFMISSCENKKLYAHIIMYPISMFKVYSVHWTILNKHVNCVL